MHTHTDTHARKETQSDKATITTDLIEELLLL